MTTYQVWDDDTGNIIASFDTRAAAVAFLQDMLEGNGAEGVRDLAIIAYPPDGADPVTVLEGAEFLAGRTVRA